MPKPDIEAALAEGLAGGPVEGPDLIEVKKPVKKSGKAAAKGAENKTNPEEPETKNLG